MSALMLLQTVLSLGYSAVTLLALAFALIWSVTHIPALKTRLRPALVLVGVVVLLGLPMQVLSLYHLDLSTLFADTGLPPDAVEIAETVMWVVGPITAIVTVLFGAGSLVLQFVAAEGAEEASTFPWLTRSQGAREGWGVALAAGAVLGVVSTVAFELLDVGTSTILEQQMAMMPGLDFEAPLVVLFALTPATLAAAISEEVVFRGVIQRWLTKGMGGSTGAVAVAVVVSSGIWAAGHAANTDAVLIKLTQIFLIGLLFGWMARRWSVEASIVAHLALNFTACTVWLVLSLAGVLS